MAPKSQSASQPTRRNIRVPSWVWSLVLLAAAALALSVYRNAQGAPDAVAQGRMIQAQESISHYSAELDARPDPPAWMIQAQPSRLNVQRAPRAASSAWDVPVGPALTNYGQTQHMADYVRQRPAAAAKFGQAEHPEREEAGFPGLPTRITEREQQILDQHNQ